MSCWGTSKNQSVNIMRAVISVHGFRFHHAAEHLKRCRNTIFTMHVTGEAGNVEHLAAVAALCLRNRVQRGVCLFDLSSDARRCFQGN